MIRVADYIIKRIADEGVKHVFYIPGGQCVYLADALRRNEDIKPISVHHEQAAAMAALTYSLYNENLGACLVTTGCAGTNTITGVLHAWQDSIPCIFVSGQQNYAQTIEASGLPLRQVGIQEADIVGLVKPITKYSVMLKNPAEIVYEIDKAIYLAREGRPGPVWIDVPLDIQNMMIEESDLIRFKPDVKKLEVKTADIEYAREALKDAKRPVILAGEGVRRAHAQESLRKFAEKNRIPVLFTRFASDIFPYEHELNFGVVGAGGAHRNANFTVQNADCVLSIGCRLSTEVLGGNKEEFAREAKVIVVDIDAVEHAKKGAKIDRFIHLDAKDFLEKIGEETIGTETNQWIDKCNHWKEVFPWYPADSDKAEHLNIRYFLSKLSERFPEKTAVTADAGLTGAITAGSLKLKEGMRALSSIAQGEMGYALPGAFGAAELNGSMVVAVCGDGSVMMNLQELQTLVRNNYNIKVIIVDNNGYSGVRHGQKAHFRGKSIGTDPSNGIDFPDYEKVAQAFGIESVHIHGVCDMEAGIERIVADDKPLVCVVDCDPEQVDLHAGLVTYGKRKFGFRPLEDFAPFVDRNLFFSEMIVKPTETSYGTPV